RVKAASVQVAVCESEGPYAWYGHVFSGDSTLIDTLPSTTFGYAEDGIWVLHVIPDQAFAHPLTVCESELPYTWYGHVFSGDSTLIETVPSTTNGCDTIRTLVLQVVPEIEVTDQLTVCERIGR